MPSAAETLLSLGFESNLEVHGETLGYLPASARVMAESGEAVLGNEGQAVLNDEHTAASITGIFDEAYVRVDVSGTGIGTVDIAAIVTASDVSGVERGAMITRSGVTYFVQEVGEEAIDGSIVLILSKHAH